MTVNFIRHFNTTMSYFQKGQTLHATHISLYVALFYTWNQYFFEYEFPVIREETMQLSRIGSIKTYLRCLQELHNCGLITYTPGHDIMNPAVVSITKWNDKDELLISPGMPRVIFDIGKGFYGGKKSMGIQGKSTFMPRAKKPSFNKQYINNVKQERENGRTHSQHPSQNEIEKYFKAVGFPEKEARKFFFHYQARGWIVNGNHIKDLEFAARKWMELQQNDAVKPGNLHVNQNKRYDIPL